MSTSQLSEAIAQLVDNNGDLPERVTSRMLAALILNNSQEIRAINGRLEGLERSAEAWRNRAIGIGAGMAVGSAGLTGLIMRLLS